LDIQPASAYHKTNKQEVRSSLESDGWIVVYSKEFDHDEYMKFAASTATGTVKVWLLDFAKESLRQLITNTARKSQPVSDQIRKNFTAESLVPALKQSFNGKQVELSPARGVRLQVGRATYNRAECARIPAPTWRDPRRTLEKCVSTPNTYQPYVRFRV
jgi:hypothetical protein